MENKDDIEAKVSKERWAALEANPEVMTKLCHQLGVSPMFEVVDVWGLDPDMLGFVPQPVVALILLFPSKSRDAKNRKITVDGHEISEKVYYLDQLRGHLDNACGTIAIIHSILNNRDILGVADSECIGENFYKSSLEKSAEERGKFLDSYQDIIDIHNKLVTQGQSNVVESEKVCHHFVSITSVDGHLVELDGAYNSGPNIINKISDSDGFLNTAAKFVQSKYISSFGENGQFALMALVMKQD